MSSVAAARVSTRRSVCTHPARIAWMTSRVPPRLVWRRPANEARLLGHDSVRRDAIAASIYRGAERWSPFAICALFATDAMAFEQICRNARPTNVNLLSSGDGEQGLPGGYIRFDAYCTSASN